MTKSELRNPRPTKRNLDAMEARRKKGMGLLARGITQAEVARRCEVSTPTALRWRRALEAKGKGAWKRRPLGQPPKIKESHRKALGRFLVEGAQTHGFTNDLWTLPRISAVLERQTGLRIHPGHLWRVLIQLGWSVQKPEKRATQRDEAAIARWKRHTWPALKKRPQPTAEPSSSSTNPA